MSTAELRDRGQVTVPKEIREAAGLEQGDILDFDVSVDGTITIRRTISIPADQAWFWTREWQHKEREVDVALAEGRSEVFENVDEFLADLES
ncbi:MAG: AbrB/MazE/SpoVT family DNA-binding domain-containing protein [Actinomycetia bacterium]|nr:AbrB/MazE/SpoVT family DNA-binding domain-containing protein [Actinomycetes bacterium]